MIKFKSVTSKNFYAIGNQPITVNFDDTHNTIVVGNNGSGKTSATIEALVYCLFGKPYRKVNLSGVVNSINKKKCLVECVFEKSGSTYKVRRGDKPKVFDIYKNDELIEKPASAKDYQAILEGDILGMDYRIFSQVVVLNRSRFVPFMSLSTSDRRYIVEEFLNINILGRMAENTKSRLKENKSKALTKSHDAELIKQAVDSKNDIIEMGIKNNKKNSEDFDNLILEQQNKLSNINAKGKQTVELLNEKKEALAEIESNPVEIDKSLSNKIEELTLKIASLTTDKRGCKQKITVYESQPDKCDECGQPLEVIDYGDKIKELHSKIADIDSELMKVEDEKKTLSEKMKGEVANVDKYKDAVRLAKSKVSEVKSELNALSNSKNEVKEYIKGLEYKKNNQADAFDVEGAMEELKELQDAYDVVNAERKEIADETKTLQFIAGMLNDGGVKTTIISKYLPLINSKINEFLSLLGFTISLVLDSEFNEKVLIPGKENFTYSNFSDGQKTRIDLAILLTWIYLSKEMNSINTNLLILDEILEALDTNGVNDFLNTIKYGFDGVNLFVISQRGQEFSDSFKNQLSFSMVDSFTQYDVNRR